MWVSRTPEEIARWNAAVEKQARSDGFQIAAMAWLGSTVVLSAGWVASFRTGVAVEGGFGGTFWTRVPVFAVATLPIALIAYRYERKKRLRRANEQTICPNCDTASSCNVGSSCSCGGSFVPQSTMKWIEEIENEPAA
jgi:hypothetical protein